jgi:hypothetical protein
MLLESEGSAAPCLGDCSELMLVRGLVYNWIGQVT